MKSRVVRCVSLVSVFMMMLLPAGAAERICSVYVESINALQQQVQKASEVFEAPELGMFPMMITMMVPGGSQVNATEPVSLHIFDLGGGRTGGVLELTPATTPEMFLKALIAASGKPLAPAVDGRFTFDNGVARVLGNRLLLAKTAGDLDLCTGGAVPALPPMPSIAGAVRIAMAPSAAVPMLKAARGKWMGLAAAAGPDAAQAKETMELMFGLYIRTLSQLNSVNVGIAVQQEGLVIRKNIAAVTGSTLAGMIASLQPISEPHLSFIGTDSLFDVAAGSYAVSDSLKKQITSLYVKMIQASPLMADANTADLKTAIRASMDALGASMVFSGGMSPDGKKVQMLGAMGMKDPAAYIEEMVALMNLPAYQTMMNQSGMKIGEAVKRMYKEVPVYTWALTIDDAMLRKLVSEQSPAGAVDEKALGMAKSMMSLFGGGYDYAAAPQGLAFGMGSPAMVEKAVDRLAAGGAASAEATRIQALLSPAAKPALIGRFSLLDMVRLVAKMQGSATGQPLPEAVVALPKGDGIVFADWIEGGDVKTAMLVPAADVKALSAMAKAMQPAPGEGEGVGGMDTGDTDTGVEDDVPAVGAAADK